MSIRRTPVLALGALLAGLLACGTGTPTAAPTDAAPLPSPSPSPNPIPPAPAVTLVSVPTDETGRDPAYTIQAEAPQLQGSADPRVLNFNNLASQLTLEEIGVFKGFLIGLDDSPVSPGSSYIQSYALLSPPGEVYSFKFVISIYYAGAAHPGSHSRTLTYDLGSGATLSLEELFEPGSPYLLVLSEFCAAELSGRGIGFEAFSTGADPIPENYSKWNLTPDGLLITFDEYQVAAYAAGPQEVLVPFSVLAGVIDPSGPLGASLP